MSPRLKKTLRIVSQMCKILYYTPIHIDMARSFQALSFSGYVHS